MQPVVSVHVPKAGGTSLYHAYVDAFGTSAVDRIRDEPINPVAPCQLDPDGWLARAAAEPWPAGRAVAHGHFPARRFAHVEDAAWVTFLRDPVERALSHYFYWLAAPLPRGHALLDYVRDNDLSFEDFVRLPLVRGLNTEVFFGGFDMGRFDVIGDVATGDRDVVRVGRLLGVELSVRHDRSNPHSAYHERVEMLRDDEALMARVKDHLGPELRFYERWAGT